MIHNPLMKEELAKLRLAAETTLTFPDYCHPTWKRREHYACSVLRLLATIAARDERVGSLEITLGGLLEHIRHENKGTAPAIVAQAVLDEPQKEKQKKLLKHHMALPYRIEIYPEEDSSGFMAILPELPGCMTCSDVFEDLGVLIREAKELWLEAAIQDGNYIPVPGAKPDRCPQCGGPIDRGDRNYCPRCDKHFGDLE